MTAVPLTDQQLVAAVAAAITADAMKPRAQRVGLVHAMLAVAQPELDRLREDLAFEQKRVAYWQECRDNYAAENKKLIADKKKLRAELEQARQQTEAAHCRLHFIAERVSRLDISEDPTGVAGDVGPYLDGPLHPDHLADYRAAQPSA